MKVIVTILLLAHCFGDFYAQWNKMAQGKVKTYAWTLLHSFFYTVCVFATVFLTLQLTYAGLLLAGFVSLSHFVVDTIKYFVVKKLQNGKSQAYAFFIDQILHMLMIVMGAWIFKDQLHVREFFLNPLVGSTYPRLFVATATMLLMKPCGFMIGNGLKILSKKNDEGVSSKPLLGNGAVIGYLERIVILFLMMQGSYAGITFVTAVKALGRYSEIKNDEDKSEYFIVGTLMSVASAILVAICFGLTIYE